MTFHRLRGWSAGALLAIAISVGPPAAAAEGGGSYYAVKKGDTISGIARRNGISETALLSANKMKSGKQLVAGKKLWIPKATATPKPAAKKPAAKPPAKKPAPRDPEPRGDDVPGGGIAKEPDPPPPAASAAPAKNTPRTGKPSVRGYLWPVEGRIIRRFVKRSDEKYTGIDIAVPRGTEVRAARDGKVVFAGDSIPGFGRMVILQHSDGMATCYAHNERILVREGQQVSRGQVVARSGDTGRGAEPHLHFEVRRNGEAVDPMPYLP